MKKSNICAVIMAICFGLSACGADNSNGIQTDLHPDTENVSAIVETDSVVKAEAVNKPLPTTKATAVLNSITVGWNLGNSLDSKSGTAGYDQNLEQETVWGNPNVTKELIDYVNSQGINAIRIPVTWVYNCGRDSEGNLIIGEKWLERVKSVVDYAYSNDMYIILNSHHDEDIFYIGTDADSFAQVQRDAEALWTQIATYFKDYDEHLMFESYNELPNKSLEEDGSQAAKWVDVTRYTENGMKQLGVLNQIFVDAVRATGGNNADRVLVLGSTYEGGRDIIMSNMVIPKDSAENAIIYDAHIYSDSMDQLFDEYLKVCEDFTASTGVPVILGECGTQGSENYGFSPLSYRPLAAANMVARAEAKGIKCFWWDNNKSTEYGIINRNDLQSSDSQMINALVSGAEFPGYTNSSVVDLTLSDVDWMQGLLSIDHEDNGTLVRGDGTFSEKTSWGNFVNDQNGFGVQIPEGSDHMSGVLTGRDEAWEFVILSYAFYDKNGKYLEGHYRSGKEIECAVPEGARYVKFCLEDLHNRHTMGDFTGYIRDGKLEFKISFVNVPKAYIYLSVDDSTYDVDLSTALVMQEHKWPITLATEVQQLDQKVTGIESFNSSGLGTFEPVGTTVLEVCKWVQDNGGEIAVHDRGYVWDADTTANMIEKYFADYYVKYNDENGTTLTQQEFIDLVISRLKESSNYNLDDPASAEIHFVERAEVLRNYGLKTYGILASGGSFKMEDYSKSLSIKSWGTAKAQEWASKYYVYSDQYGTSGNYFNPRHQMATFVKNGSESAPGQLDEAALRGSLESCIQSGGIHGYYWHYVSGNETAGSTYNRMSLEMYIRVLDILQEYVDSGDLAVVNPGTYYMYLGYSPMNKSLYSSNSSSNSTSVPDVEGENIDDACTWEQYLGIDGKGNMYSSSEVFKTVVMSAMVKIETDAEYVYVSTYNRNNKPKVKVHYFKGDTYIGKSDILSTGRTEEEVVIPIEAGADGFRIELSDVAESLKDDIVSGMHVYVR